jgi:hypothetical protein
MPIYGASVRSPIIILNSNKGWIVPGLITGNAATYSQTGTTITVTSTGHLIPATIHNGKDVYLVIGSGLATTGWFTNFTYVDANSFTCTSSVSQSTSGAVNTNLSQITVSALTVTIPANILGLNGSIRTSAIFSCNNSAGAKTLRVLLANSAYITDQATTAISFAAVGRVLSNINNTQKQVSHNQGSTGAGSSTLAVVNLAVDTTTAQDLTVKLQVAVASDYIALESIQHELVI